MATAQREWFEKDYYKALGVSETASEAEIRRAYRKLAKQYHPDAHPGSEDRFKEVSAAYEVLSDPGKRKEYDEVRRLGPMAAGGFPGGPRGAPGAGGNFTFTTDDIGDLFGNLFGRFRPGSERANAGPQRGADVETELHLSFLDAVQGVTTTVNVTGEATCRTCHGTGAAPGTSPVICPRCSGRGVIDDNQGFFSFSRTCPQCGGAGMFVESPCPTCGGSGVERRPRQVRVRIPAGVTDGQRIRLKGRGGAGRNGGPSGDLYVTVHVAPHSLFGRRGRDLTLTVPVTFAEAALGAEIAVPTLDGTVTVKVPPGTRSGRTLRVRKRGIQTPNGTGDLLVTVEVAVPTNLSAAERQAIEALAAASTESPRSHLGV
jgi:molecular chaperone DnaJ